MNNDFSEYNLSRREQKNTEQRERMNAEAVNASTDRITSAISESTKTIVSNQPKVEIKNKDLAKTNDVQEVVNSINSLNLTTFIASKDSWSDVVENMATLAERMKAVVSDMDSTGVKRIEKAFTDSLTKLEKLVSTFKNVKVENDSELKQALSDISYALTTLDFKPTVNVPQPKVVVEGKDVDLSPLVKVLTNLDEQIKSIGQTEIDFSDLSDKLENVNDSIQELIAKPVPVPEYPTTIKISNSQGQDILDPTAGYAPSDIDESGDPKYYGFLAADGRWYIMRNASDTTYRYVAGSSAYATAWTNRASQTYDYFSEVF